MMEKATNSTFFVDTTDTLTTGIGAYVGVWETKQVVHLLKRTMFGARKVDVDYFKNLTLSATVDALLDTIEPLPAPPINNYNTTTEIDPIVPAGQTWVNDTDNGGATYNGRRRDASYRPWWVGQMLNQNRTLREKMTLFWHNHFATEYDTIGDSRWCYWHNYTLRQYALGNFKAFVKAITLDSGMLRYLNGYVNIKSAPDENYARELQELFCIGKGTNSKYTEDDVKAAAKVLTGFTVNGKINNSYNFVATNHDSTDKKFSAFYNNTTIKGFTGAAGQTELGALLDMLFKTDELALFICRKLYTFFVYYNITPEVEATIIVPLAKIFRDNNYEIKPVLRALFKSEHFFDSLNMGCVIKPPLDITIGFSREMNIVFPDTADYVNAYFMWLYIMQYSSLMGQEVHNPPNVAGWVAYYQIPQFYELWINSDTLPKRNLFTDTLLSAGYTRNSKKIVADILAVTAMFLKPEDPNLLISDIIAYFYMIDVPQITKDSLKKDFLLSGQSSDYYWSDAWNAYKAAPTNTMAKNIVLQRLTSLYQYVFKLSEYQLC